MAGETDHSGGRRRFAFVRWAYSFAQGGFFNSRFSLHAAGLTYYTLLSVVPVLCLFLFFAKICGAGDFARARINDQIAAAIENVERGQGDGTAAGDERQARKVAVARELGAQARVVSDQIFDRIDKFDVNTLGWVGFAMLLWTVIGTMGQIEESMNDVWGAVAPRPIWKRGYLYLFTAVVLPLLVAAALSLPVLQLVKTVLDATLGATVYTRWAGDALLAALDSRLCRFAVSATFATSAFAFLIGFMPNVRVRLMPALVGGFVTAILFVGWFKVCVVAQVGIANSSALYGSFALLPIVLAWVFVGWRIFLLGAYCAHALQTRGVGVRVGGGAR